MTTQIQMPTESDLQGHPIDMMERLADSQEWPAVRSSEEDISLSVAGKYGDYELAVSWREEMVGLHLACLLGIKTPPNKRAVVLDLLARINERLWLGHFDVWENEGALLFRSSMMMTAPRVSIQQCDKLIAYTFRHCEQFTPAFNYVIWAGYSVQEAMDACLLETKGDA